MAQVTYYGTGRRKSSIARVRLVPGEGKVTINGRESFVRHLKKLALSRAIHVKRNAVSTVLRRHVRLRSSASVNYLFLFFISA